MRGEETQIAGFLDSQPGFAGVICSRAPSARRFAAVAAFRTFMTRELFALLAEHSVLRHGIGLGWDADGFAAALAAAAESALTAHLFGLRAEGLLAGLAPGAARARLSGLLIGSELVAAQSFPKVGGVVVFGASDLADLYVAALLRPGPCRPPGRRRQHDACGPCRRTRNHEGSSQ